MITVKSEEEIKIMKEGGGILAWVMAAVVKKAKPGVTTQELDQFAEGLIKKRGGLPSFKMVPKYNWATCMCVNDCVVHGIPNKHKLKEGDVLGIDIGIFYEGFHTDMARTLRVRNKKVSPKRNFLREVNIKNKKLREIDRFLKTGKIALKRAIEQARVGNRLGHISKAIQDTVEEASYSVVKTLVGHGVGEKLHEEPEIPCFLKSKIKDSPSLQKGMTLAVEVIYNLGSEETVLKQSDGWTILTKDGKLSGLFEDTVAVTEKGPIVLTK